MEPIDTANRFMVASQGDEIAIFSPPKGPISKSEALGLAAHLVALADDHDAFPSILEAVRNI